MQTTKQTIGNWILAIAATLAATDLIRLGVTKRRLFDHPVSPLVVTISITDTLWQETAVERVKGDTGIMLVSKSLKDPVTGEMSAAFVPARCGTFAYHARLMTQTGRMLRAAEQQPIIVNIDGCK